MTLLTKACDDLRPDEPASADDDDLHGVPPFRRWLAGATTPKPKGATARSLLPAVPANPSGPGSHRRPHLDVVKKRIASRCLVSAPPTFTLSEPPEPGEIGDRIARGLLSLVLTANGAKERAITATEISPMTREPTTWVVTHAAR